MELPSIFISFISNGQFNTGSIIGHWYAALLVASFFLRIIMLYPVFEACYSEKSCQVLLLSVYFFCYGSHNNDINISFLVIFSYSQLTKVRKVASTSTDIMQVVPKPHGIRAIVYVFVLIYIYLTAEDCVSGDCSCLIGKKIQLVIHEFSWR